MSLRQVFWAALLLGLSLCAHAQQQQIYCNAGNLIACSTTGNTGSGVQGDPAWKAFGKVNANENYLFGIVGPPLINTNPFTFGTCNTAVGQSEVANSSHAAQVICATPPTLASLSYPTNDAVGTYSDNNCLAPVASTVAGTFTTTTFVPTSPFSGGTVANFRVGMLVITQESGTFFRGQITAFAANGTSITVSGWFQQGNSAAGQTPTPGDTVTINPFTKCWGGNTVLTVPSGSIAGTESGAANIGAGAVWEFDYNDTGAVGNGWGVDSNNLTSTTEFAAYLARNKWTNGFLCFSTSSIGSCFASAATSGTILQATSLTSGTLINALDFSVSALGQMDLGSQTSSAIKPINLHSSGHATADSYITGNAGSGAGDGQLVEVAGLTCLSALNSATGCGNEAFRVVQTASQVDRVQVTGSVTGSPGSATVAAAGADGNVNLVLGAKGSGGNVLLQVNSATVLTASAASLTAAQPVLLPRYSAAGTPAPTCNAGLHGAIAVVTDATGPTYNSTYTSGGSVEVIIECNGSNWTTH